MHADLNLYVHENIIYYLILNISSNNNSGYHFTKEFISQLLIQLVVMSYSFTEVTPLAALVLYVLNISVEPQLYYILFKTSEL